MNTTHAYVMVPHTVNRDRLVRMATTLGHRSGVVTNKLVAQGNGPKHHAIRFSCDKHAGMFVSMLEAIDIKGTIVNTTTIFP
jgi:hypothetical protein